MKMYQLLWRRIVGLSCLFLLGLFMITLNGVPRRMELVEEPQQRPQTEPSLTLSKTSISNAISYVGGKLRLLVAYSAPNDQLSKDSKNDNYRYDDDFDIIGDEEESYQGDIDTSDDDDIENPNKTFRVGDFDYDEVLGNRTNSTLTSRVLKTTEVYKNKFLSNLVNIDSKSQLPVVRDIVYWSNELETLYPKGMSDIEVISFVGATKKGRVSRVEPPTWNRCGRPKNQFVIFQDGTRACARYRSPHHYLVQGEVMSFYLSRLLGINNVPTVTLSSIDAGRQWRDPGVVKALREAGWETNATIALIQWVDGLERDRMPALVLQALKKGKTIHPSSDELRQLKTNQLVELMQWSDLVLFDYITGNYDRVASMQDAADRERKPSILSETIHNLVKSRQTRTIWLIDNESGLLDAYSLLYGPPNGGEGPPVTTTKNPSVNRFIQFHRDMLRTMCVFRRSTVHRIAWLSQKTRPARVLMNYLLKREPLYRRLPDVTRNSHFIGNFKKRLTEVRLHVERCQKLGASTIHS